MIWRYAKESVRKKIEARDLTDALLEDTLTMPDSVIRGNKGRLIAQKEKLKEGGGILLVRVIYEMSDNQKVVVSAYWARPTRYSKIGVR